MAAEPSYERLIHHFDQGYQAFTEKLPKGLIGSARKLSTFTGSPEDQYFQISADLNPIYARTPWLFGGLFEAVSDELFLDLALAGGLVSLASLLMDHLIDGQAEQPEATAALRHAFLQQGVGHFHRHFPWKTPFWNHFRYLHREHLRSVEIERTLQLHPRKLSLQEFEDMAGGKASPVVITMAALVEKAGNKTWLAPVEQSLKHTCIAGQLHDDVLDWRPDLASNHLTYFLSQFLDGNEEDPRRLPAEPEILNRLDRSWLDVAHLEQAMVGYRQALAVVDGLDCPAWRELLDGYLSAAEQHRGECIRAHVIRRLGQIDEADLRAVLQD